MTIIIPNSSEWLKSGSVTQIYMCITDKKKMFDTSCFQRYLKSVNYLTKIIRKLSYSVETCRQNQSWVLNRLTKTSSLLFWTCFICNNDNSTKINLFEKDLVDYADFLYLPLLWTVIRQDLAIMSTYKNISTVHILLLVLNDTTIQQFKHVLYNQVVCYVFQSV